jgi:hypothetical protein
MKNVARIAIIIYLAQAAIGIAAGLALPWLRLFGAI